MAPRWDVGRKLSTQVERGRPARSGRTSRPVAVTRIVNELWSSSGTLDDGGRGRPRSGAAQILFVYVVA